MTTRGLALVLLLGAGWMPHTHADHDGGVPHIEAAHGSHGIGTATHGPRLPAGKLMVLIAPVLVVPATSPPVMDAPRPGFQSIVDRPRERDPPRAHGSRAPPPLSA